MLYGPQTLDHCSSWPMQVGWLRLFLCLLAFSTTCVAVMNSCNGYRKERQRFMDGSQPQYIVVRLCLPVNDDS